MTEDMYICVKEVYMDTQNLIDMLPTDIVNCKDVNALRNLREHIDSLVQNVKHEKEVKNIEKYRQIYEGKFMLTYARVPYLLSSIKEYNTRDMTISKIVSVLFVGRGFIRCKVKALKIKYDGERYGHSAGAGLLNKVYRAAEIEYIEDENYDINLGDEPMFINETEIRRLIEEFEDYKTDICNSFKLERTGNDERK